MICDSCKNDPALFSDADRKRMEDDKWEERRFYAATKILAATLGEREYRMLKEDDIDYAIVWACRLVDKLRRGEERPRDA